jgi:hypothetical protein
MRAPIYTKRASAHRDYRKEHFGSPRKCLHYDESCTRSYSRVSTLTVPAVQLHFAFSTLQTRFPICHNFHFSPGRRRIVSYRFVSYLLCCSVSFSYRSHRPHHGVAIPQRPFFAASLLLIGSILLIWVYHGCGCTTRRSGRRRRRRRRRRKTRRNLASTATMMAGTPCHATPSLLQGPRSLLLLSSPPHGTQDPPEADGPEENPTHSLHVRSLGVWLCGSEDWGNVHSPAVVGLAPSDFSSLRSSCVPFPSPPPPLANRPVGWLCRRCPSSSLLDLWRTPRIPTSPSLLRTWCGRRTTHGVVKAVRSRRRSVSKAPTLAPRMAIVLIVL